MKAKICHKSQKIHPNLLFFEGFWTFEPPFEAKNAVQLLDPTLTNFPKKGRLWQLDGLVEYRV